jgi:hypothetical protein
VLLLVCLAPMPASARVSQNASSPAALRKQVRDLERQIRSLRAMMAQLQAQGPAGQGPRVSSEAADSGGVHYGDFEVKGRLNAAAGTGIAFNADGNLDGKGGSDPNPYRVGLGVGAVNGSNGPRGDSVLTDTANGAGASFFAPYYLQSNFRTTGSLTGYTAYLDVDETAKGGQYGEAMPFYGGVVTRRLGALTSGAELQNTVEAGSPARATGANVIVRENNPLSAYADKLRGTAWATTGSRGVDVISQGSHPVGVGVLLRGGAGYERAIALQSGGGSTPFSVGGDGQVALAGHAGTDTVLRTLVDGEGQPRLMVRADGRLVWGDGRVPRALTLERNGANTLRTNGRLIADRGLGVGNSRRAKKAGKLVRKMEVFDRNGRRLGFVPIYR